MAVAIALAGCVSAPVGTQSYKLYPGPARPLAEIAVIRLEPRTFATIDGLTAFGGEWAEVQLAPGRHKLEFSDRGECTLYEKEATLLAGQTYRVRSRIKAFGSCAGHLEDGAGRDVITW